LTGTAPANLYASTVDRDQYVSALAFAPLLRRAPPAGVPPRPFLLQWARSDQVIPKGRSLRPIPRC
jgi:hypothetical protein